EHEHPAEQHQQAVGGGGTGWSALGQVGLERPPGPAALAAQQPAAEGGGGEYEHERPGRSDHAPDRDQHRDLHDRNGDEERDNDQQTAHDQPVRRRVSARLMAAIRACTPQTVTRQSASRTIAEFILLAPRSRSAKVIGTSATRNPLRCARQARSTWKQYPCEETVSRSIFSRAAMR